MLADFQQKLQAFEHPDFWFDPEPHDYYLGETPLVAWSRWIEKYVTPFPEQAAAKASASKRGCSVQEVLDEWQWSRDLGTLVHAWIEQWYALHLGRGDWNAELALPTNPDVRARCAKFLHLHKLRLSELQPVFMELKALNEQAGVAGTIDFGAHHPRRKGITVIDWKTNSKFDRNSGVGRFTKRMLGPLADLWDTKENLYSLQNSFYRVLLEEKGIPTETGALIWLPPGDTPAEIIPAIDYRDRIRQLLFN